MFSVTISPSEAAKLQSILGLQFYGEGLETRVIIDEGNGYRCKEITLRGEGNGCVDLKASTDSEATTKCALVAQQRSWFGGVASTGTCNRSLSLGQLFRR
jgi:hypothetical protein